MIEITNQFMKDYPKAVKKARTERIRCVRLMDDLFFAARMTPGHGRYLVRFFHKGDSINAVCSTIYNEPCPSRKSKDRCCAHIAICVLRGIQDGRKRQRAAA